MPRRLGGVAGLQPVEFGLLGHLDEIGLDVDHPLEPLPGVHRQQGPLVPGAVSLSLAGQLVLGPRRSAARTLDRLWESRVTIRIITGIRNSSDTSKARRAMS